MRVRMGTNCIRAWGNFMEWWKYHNMGQQQWLHNFAHLLQTIELHTYNEWINYTSIKLFLKTQWCKNKGKLGSMTRWTLDLQIPDCPQVLQENNGCVSSTCLRLAPSRGWDEHADHCPAGVLLETSTEEMHQADRRGQTTAAFSALLAGLHLHPELQTEKKWVKRGSEFH